MLRKYANKHLLSITCLSQTVHDNECCYGAPPWWPRIIISVQNKLWITFFIFNCEFNIALHLKIQFQYGILFRNAISFFSFIFIFRLKCNFKFNNRI